MISPLDFLFYNVAAHGGSPPPVGPTWNPTNGVNKSSHVALSNGNLTNLTDAAGGFNLVRATQVAGTTKFQFEITITNTPGGRIYFGLDNGTVDLSPDAQVPGATDSNGICLTIQSTGWSVRQSGGSGPGGRGAGADIFVAGDKATLEMDTVAHTLSFYRNNALMNDTGGGGVSAYIGTMATLSAYYAYIGGDTSGANGATANFTGTPAFTHALNAGYSAYG
jgi:hypothetical protein